MKKILFASSALVALGFAGAAQASEPIKLSVGGYMEQWAGFSDSDINGTGGRPNAFQSDTEVHFRGATTLDNGIEIGAVIELEGETSSDQVDEQYLFINGGFGRIEFGKNDSAADAMGVAAPAVGPVGVSDGDLTSWVEEGYLIDTVPSSGDQNRVTYYTPVLGGFRAGISFADDSGRNGVFNRNVNGGAIGGLHSDSTGSGENIVSAGLTYAGDLGGASLSLSAEGENWGDGSWYGLGANVGFGAFTVGGSWGHTEDDYGLVNDTAADETDAFDLGVSYAMDAATVSLSYAYADYGNGDNTDETGEVSTVDLGMAYALGAGVSWRSSIFWYKDEPDGADENEAYGVVTGLRLDF